ncbi:MAG: VOC family protein [Pseudohongiellaceae bacterium]
MLQYIKFTNLPVSNQKRAVRFYREKLGMRILQNTPYKNDWRWIELGIPGAETAIVLVPKKNIDPDDLPALVLAVDDVQSTYEELQARGVVFTQGPQPAPWNPEQRFALFRDSEGNTVLIGSSYDE